MLCKGPRDVFAAALLIALASPSAPSYATAKSFAFGEAQPKCEIGRVDGGALPKMTYFNDLSANGFNNVWAVGYYELNTLQVLYALADHWDGQNWTVTYPPNVDNTPTTLSGVFARSANDVWAVGAGAEETLAEHWDGDMWSIVSSPNVPNFSNSFNDVAAFAVDDAIAVGEYVDNENNYFPLVERWHGSAWSIVRVPGPRNGFYFSVAGTSGHDVWTVGGILPPKSPSEEPLALHFDGSNWRAMRPPMPPHAIDALFDGVVAISPNDVWAVGASSKGGGIYVNLTEHWNGTSWSIVPSPNVRQVETQGLVSVSASGPNDVWAVGGESGAVAMHWDGTSWRLVDVSETFQKGSVLWGVASGGPTMFTAGYNVNKPRPPVIGTGACSSVRGLLLNRPASAR